MTVRQIRPLRLPSARRGAGHRARRVHWDRAAAATAGRPGYLAVHGRREELRRPQGGAGREPLRAARRGGRTARPERRRQDHGVLHDHRPDQGRSRAHPVRRPRHHRTADVSARAPRHRLSAAGGLDLPRPQCRGQHPRGARSGRAEQEEARARARRAARGVQHHAAAQDALDRALRRRAPPHRDRARARDAARPTCCSTSRSPASIRSRSATSSRWCGTSPSAASAC